jgi:hypothetical protein
MLKLTLLAAAAALLSAVTLSTAHAAPLVAITAAPVPGVGNTGPTVEKVTYFRYGYGHRYYDRPYYGRSYIFGRSYGRRYH